MSKESEKKTLIDTYERTISELKAKNEDLSTKNTDLIESKLNLESSQRENLTKLRNFERENMVLQQEHNRQKEDLMSLKRRNVELETKMTEFKVKSEILDK